MLPLSPPPEAGRYLVEFHVHRLNAPLVDKAIEFGAPAIECEGVRPGALAFSAEKIMRKDLAVATRAANQLAYSHWALRQDTFVGAERDRLAAYVAGQNGNQKASSDFRMRQILARPVHLAARPHPASVGVVVISPGVYGDALVADPFFQHFTPNFPSQLARVAADRFTFDSVFVDAGPGAVSLLPRDRPLVCLNNVTNAEILRTGQTLAQVRALEQAIGARCSTAPTRPPAAPVS